MEVSGQRHAPAALYPRGKNPQYPLDRRVWTQGLEKNPPLSGIEPRSPDRPARSQTIYYLDNNSEPKFTCAQTKVRAIVENVVAPLSID
jgi:hypothetical protein